MQHLYMYVYTYIYPYVPATPLLGPNLIIIIYAKEIPLAALETWAELRSSSLAGKWDGRHPVLRPGFLSHRSWCNMQMSTSRMPAGFKALRQAARQQDNDNPSPRPCNEQRCLIVRRLLSSSSSSSASSLLRSNSPSSFVSVAALPRGLRAAAQRQLVGRTIIMGITEKKLLQD